MNLFFIIITYTAPLHLIDMRLEEHGKFLKEGYDSGMLLVSGRQVPRTGGMIVARATTRDEVEKFIEGDPLRVHELADHWIVEVTPTMYDPAFAPFVE